MVRCVPFVQADESGRGMTIAQVQDGHAERRIPGRYNRDSVCVGGTQNRKPSRVRDRGVGEGIARPYVRPVAEIEEDANRHRRTRQCRRGETYDEEEDRGRRGSPPPNLAHLELPLKYG